MPCVLRWTGIPLASLALSRWGGGVRRRASCAGPGFRSLRSRYPGGEGAQNRDGSPRPAAVRAVLLHVSRRASSPFAMQQNSPVLSHQAAVLFCGEIGIRTRDTLLGYTRFPGVPLKPLEHLSKASPVKRECKYTNNPETFSMWKTFFYLFRFGTEMVND